MPCNSFSLRTTLIMSLAPQVSQAPQEQGLKRTRDEVDEPMDENGESQAPLPKKKIGMTRFRQRGRKT